MNKFLVLSEGPTSENNGSFGSAEKKFSIILVKQTKNLVWVCIIMMIVVICLLIEKKSLSLKPTISLNFPTQFYLTIKNKMKYCY